MDYSETIHCRFSRIFVTIPSTKSTLTTVWRSQCYSSRMFARSCLNKPRFTYCRSKRLAHKPQKRIVNFNNSYSCFLLTRNTKQSAGLPIVTPVNGTTVGYLVILRHTVGGITYRKDSPTQT